MPHPLIINADDFGLSIGVDAGIIEAHVSGVLTSTSLMVLRPGAPHAAELARRHSSLSVGLHLDDQLDVDLDDPDQAARTFAEQLERFRELIGADPTHVDSHHHSHATPRRLPIYSALVAPLGVPLRHDGRVTYLGGFWGQTEDRTPALDRVSREALLELVRSIAGDGSANDGFTEIGCHPARVTGDFQSSYLTERETELQTLTSPGLREAIEASGVELVSYRDWGSRTG
jgi:chitin disaccharide deacetylase